MFQNRSELESLDLDAVTMAPQPRAPFRSSGRHICDWAQTTDDVTLFIALAPNIHSRALSVVIRPRELRIGLRVGGGALVAGTLGGEVDAAESEWVVERIGYTLTDSW